MMKINLLLIICLYISCTLFAVEEEKEHIQRVLVALANKDQNIRAQLNPQDPDKDIINRTSASS